VAALLVNKGRSALTSLGIVIGISAVIAMVAAGEGARYWLDKSLESVGKNLIVIRAGAHTSSGAVADYALLSSDDAAAIRKQVGSFLVGVIEVQLTQQMASTRTANWPTLITGSTPEMRTVRNWQVQGRFYTEDEVKKAAPVCLLGQTVRRKLFPDTPNPLGQSVRVGRLQLKVIGMLGEKGRSPTGVDQDDQIFIPLTTLQQKLVGEKRVTTILAAVHSQNLLDKAKDDITRVLRDRRHLKGVTQDFDVSTVQEMASLAVVLTATLQLLIAFIASISLVVGGIGIMNIMLVSVTERTREIGIRMAVGATSGDVLLQFLIEAVVLALLGGIIGITLGILGAVGLAQLAGWPAIVSPAVVLVAFAVAAAVGIFFGYYPAYKASRLDPIEALRYE
jgi:putative ABC transport system permease protein